MKKEKLTYGEKCIIKCIVAEYLSNRELQENITKEVKEYYQNIIDKIENV